MVREEDDDDDFDEPPPRAYTAQECRDMFLDRMRALIDHVASHPEGGDVRSRLETLAHSFLRAYEDELPNMRRHSNPPGDGSWIRGNVVRGYAGGAIATTGGAAALVKECTAEPASAGMTTTAKFPEALYKTLVPVTERGHTIEREHEVALAKRDETIALLTLEVEGLQKRVEALQTAHQRGEEWLTRVRGQLRKARALLGEKTWREEVEKS